MKCSECKHWTRTTSIYAPQIYGDCLHSSVRHISDGKGTTPSDGIGYSAFEGGMASIEFGEDFGCIHFEVKEKSRSFEDWKDRSLLLQSNEVGT